jgi:hypothetical protein
MTEHNPAPQSERKPYAEPQLVEYGDIEDLTQAGGTAQIDVDGASGVP